MSHYEAQNLIGYIALILGYLVYRKSIIDEYKSWIDLAKTFKNELNYAKAWIGTGYNKSHPDANDPSKIVYPLTSECAKAFIARGHPPESLFSNEFMDKVVLYNERVQAFNHVLNMQSSNYVINTVTAREKAKYINDIIHPNLLGKKDPWSLYNLYNYFDEELKVIFKKGILVPWYVNRSKLIIILSFVAYLLIDYCI